MEPDVDDQSRQPETGTGKGWTILFVVSLALLFLVVSFGAGIIAERTLFSGGALLPGNSTSPGDPFAGDGDLGRSFPRIAEVKHLLEAEYFYRPTSPDAVATFSAELDRDALAGMAVAAATPAVSMADYHRDLEYAGIHGMTSGLDDEYTVFLEPAAQAPLAEDLRGEYEGIGVVVNQPEGRFTVVSVFPGSPAEAAGLQPNDVILEADGQPLTGVDSPDALSLIRGPAGTSVRLKIEREGVEPFEVDVERQPIETPAVAYEAVADGTIGWIRIGIFGDKTTEQLDAALKQAHDDGVSGIILDLRGNGGGWVTSAQEVIGRFVPADRGPALFEDHLPGTGDELDPRPIINGGPMDDETPLVVLIDGGTASAAEIVAGALSQYGRAQLVGAPTFGKGSVQRVHDFSDGSSARVTSAQWLTPDKAPIPDDGLQPAIEVASATSPEDSDLQLERAIEALGAAARRMLPQGPYWHD